MNFVDMILFHARAQPERMAVVAADRWVTYRQLGHGLLAMERRLAEAGVKPADMVALVIDDPIRHVVAVCALHRLGVASVSLRDSSGVPLDKLGVTLALTDRTTPLNAAARVLLIDDGWLGGPPLADGGRGFANPNAPSRIFLSSGTTGFPKAIVCSAAQIDSRILTTHSVLMVGSWERMLIMPGLSTYFGYCIAITALYVGRSIYFANAPIAVLQMIDLYQIESLAAATQQVQALMDARAKARYPCGSLREIRVGGSMLTSAFLDRVRSQLCPLVLCGYGSTEAGTVTFGGAERLGAIDGAVGFAFPWAEVEIVDEQERPCPPGETGIIRMRVEGQSPSYDLPGTPAASDDYRDGWFYPGDIARMTEDGMLVISGRTGDIINIGGAKFAPELVEEALRAHPDIADAAALGVMGPGGVAELWVAVVTRNTLSADTVMEHCQRSGPKVRPKQVKFVAAIPRNELAKVARDALKKMMIPAEPAA